MLFNSYIYIFLFFPVVAAVYFALNRMRLVLAAKAWLVLASLFFYSYWNPVYLPIILGSMLVNYGIGTALSRAAEKGAGRLTVSPQGLLLFGILLNLGLLGYYKYADFFIANLNWAGAGLPLLHLVLPLAISFFTFQQIAYLVDSYRNETREYDFLNYCLFVSFFPQLIAGPIVHHREMMPQFASLRNSLVNYRNIAVGLMIFSLGLFKKVGIADSFAVWATAGFDQAPVLNLVEAWAASMSYTLQLYFDFSGYTDMAIGSALLFNIRLPLNFNSPYKAVNIQDFWRRWHMTLSRWLRDYLYIPLGGSKHGETRTYVNLFLTFLLGGLWHGAGWTFVLWGGMHGIGTSVHRFWQSMGLKMPRWLGWSVTFLFVHCAWVFFRATTFDDAMKVFRGMVGLTGVMLPEKLQGSLATLAPAGVTFGKYLENIGGSDHTVFMVLIFALVAFLGPNSMELKERFRPSFRYMILVAAVLIAGLLNLTKMAEFLYFNF
ncbi:MBOAT family O-acyltransferase [Trichloromonas sp.]|uniref:MBOAT family O-acyltransferase n=1 Tax=Trichloromonas sp. TaxID=3069249 RepID=UPI003D81578A